MSGNMQVVWGGGTEEEEKVEIHAIMSYNHGFVATKWKSSSF